MYAILLLQINIHCLLYRNWKEGACLAIHYTILLSLVSPAVALGHILLGGLLTATIVTVTHTAEELMTDYNPSFVDTQFRTTRDARYATLHIY
jgi:uncharacterized MnhB-related membrane protein